jgi:hypothetical protein
MAFTYPSAHAEMAAPSENATVGASFSESPRRAPQHDDGFLPRDGIERLRADAVHPL